MVVKQKERNWRPQTQLIRGGTRRTGFDETDEAIFMTSGFVYEKAEDAEAAFKKYMFFAVKMCENILVGGLSSIIGFY